MYFIAPRPYGHRGIVVSCVRLSICLSVCPSKCLKYLVLAMLYSTTDFNPIPLPLLMNGPPMELALNFIKNIFIRPILDFDLVG